MQISLIDLAIILAFLLITLIVGFLEKKRLTLSDYWVNSRKTSVFVLFCSMLSSFMGASVVIAFASIGYIGGTAGMIIGASFSIAFLVGAWLFAPRLKALADKHGSFTLPDLMAVRYSARVRIAAGVVNLFVFFFFLASQFIALAALVHIITGMAFAISLFLSVAVLLAYVAFGGIRADFRTDVFQFFITIFLIMVFLPALVIKAGGVAALSKLPANYFTGTAFAGPEVLLAAFLLTGLTVFVSMDVWVRIFAAKTPKTAKQAMKLSGIFMFVYFVAFTLVGMFARTISQSLDPNQVTPLMLTSTLPVGLLGLGISGLIAALMSSADTQLLVLSSTLLQDFYRGFMNKKASDEHILKLSHVVSVVLGLIAVGVALMIPNIVQLAINAVSVSLVLLPATIGLLFWKRATSAAAFWSIIVGFVVTIALLQVMPREAFIPGFLSSSIIFVALSMLPSMLSKSNRISRDIKV